jgi:hypothetical protein
MTARVTGGWGSQAGSVSNVEVSILHRPSKGISIDKQADDEVMHLRRFREADGLANQAFDAGSKRQMFAFDFLRVAFADGVLFRVEMTCVRPPLIGIVMGQAKGFQERFEFEEDFILAASKDIRQNRPRTVINGMPEPTWVVFVADIRPHFVHLRLAGPLNVHGYLHWIQRVQQGCVDRLQRRFFLLELAEHGVGTDLERPGRIAYPTGIETHVDEELLDLGQTASIAVVEQKTAGGARWVLAEITLGSAGGFAALGNLTVLAVRASDGDPCWHGALLRDGCWEDVAQYGINFS